MAGRRVRVLGLVFVVACGGAAPRPGADGASARRAGAALVLPAISPVAGLASLSRLRIAGHEDGAECLFVDGLRARVVGDVATIGPLDDEPIADARHAASGWVFVLADGTVRRTPAFLDPFGPDDPGPPVHGLAGRGRVVVARADGKLLSSDGSAPFALLPAPDASTRLIGAIFRTASVGVVVGADGRAWTTSDAGAHYAPLDLGDTVALGVETRAALTGDPDDADFALDRSDGWRFLGEDGALGPTALGDRLPIDRAAEARRQRAVAAALLHASPAVVQQLAVRLADGRHALAIAGALFVVARDGTVTRHAAPTPTGEVESAWGARIVFGGDGERSVTDDGTRFTPLPPGAWSWSSDGVHAVSLGDCHDFPRTEYDEMPIYVRGALDTLCVLRADGHTHVLALRGVEDVVAMDGADVVARVAPAPDDSTFVSLDAETGARRPLAVRGFTDDPEFGASWLEALPSGELAIASLEAEGAGPRAGPIALRPFLRGVTRGPPARHDARHGYGVVDGTAWLVATTDGITWRQVRTPTDAPPSDAARCDADACVLGRVVLPTDPTGVDLRAAPFARALTALPGPAPEVHADWDVTAAGLPSRCSGPRAPPPDVDLPPDAPMHALAQDVDVTARAQSHGLRVTWAGAHGRVSTSVETSALWAHAAIGDVLVVSLLHAPDPALLGAHGLVPLTGAPSQSAPLEGDPLGELLPDGRLILVDVHGALARVFWIDPRTGTMSVRRYPTAGDVGLVRSGPYAGAVVLGRRGAPGQLDMVDPSAPDLVQPFASLGSTPLAACCAPWPSAVALTLLGPPIPVYLGASAGPITGVRDGPSTRDLELAGATACVRRVVTDSPTLSAFADEQWGRYRVVFTPSGTGWSATLTPAPGRRAVALPCDAP